jgi:N-acetylglucosamine-6-phosphate deacetylase
MRKNMEAVRIAMDAQRGMSKTSSLAGQPSRILGVHLEGPFLSPQRCGALNKKYFARPSSSLLKELISGYEDIVKIVTVAPEMPGALSVIERCSGMGIKVNMGHSDATFQEAVEGKKAGATGITHIFNAMRPFHHREPGLAGLGLIDEDLYIEVIADGIHLHSGVMELIFSRKRLDRIILVSDSVKTEEQKGIPVYRKKGVLAGSGITLSDSAGLLRDIGIPDAEIIEAAVDNPARYIGCPLPAGP